MKGKIHNVGVGLGRYLIKHWARFLFVLIPPLLLNLYLLRLETKILRYPLPPNYRSENTISNFISGYPDALSETRVFNSDLLDLLRFNVSLENNIYLQGIEKNSSTVDTTLAYTNSAGDTKSLLTDQSGLIATDLNMSSSVAAAMDFVPQISIPSHNQTMALLGELDFEAYPNAPSEIIQYLLILILWFQLVQVYIYIFL